LKASARILVDSGRGRGRHDIILNLKQVPLKLNNDQPKTIFVNVENPGVVTSAMIEEDADFAVLDKTVYVATVNEGGKLQLEMRVKNGRGYVSADRNFDEDLPIGYIPVDSVHSPVRKSIMPWKRRVSGR